MNQIKIISIFLLVVVLFFSCEKEEEKLLTNNDKIIYQTASLSSNPTSCGYIDELCNPCELQALEKLPDFVVCCGLVVNDEDGNSFRIRSIPMFSESDEYFVTTSDGSTYIITNTTNEYIKSRSESFTIPRVLNNIFRLDQTKLESGNYSDAEISSDLGIAVSRNGNNEINISTSLFNDFDDDIQARPMDPCKMQFMKTMELYLEKLNMPDIITTSASTWMSVVDPVFKDCAEGINLDVDCIDTRCIVDGLINLESFNWNSDQLKHIKTNYLSLLFGLDETKSEALANASLDFIEELFSLSNCGSLVFCPVTSNPNGILSSLLDNIIAEGDLTIDALNTQLQSEDHIIIRNTAFEDCPKILNIINDIVGNDSTSPMCNIMNTFGQSENANWVLSLGPDSMVVNGNTTIKFDDKNAITSINPALCDSSCMLIASVLIHEFIHAEMARFVFDKLPNGQHISWALYNKVWNAVAEELYGGNDNKHVLMGEHYIDEISIAIWELLGMQGDSLDYAFWGYHGIGMNNLWANGDTILTPMQWDSVQLNYFTNIEPNIDYDCD